MKYFLSLTIVVIIISCSKENEIQSVSVLECLGEVELPTTPTNCSDLNPNELFCEIIQFDDIKLEVQSKEFMVHACNNLNDNLKYLNEFGQEIIFKISEKIYRTNTIVYSKDNCQLDTLKSQAICINGEEIKLVFNSISPSLEIILEIKTLPFVKDDEMIGIGDFLQISRRLNETAIAIGINAVLSQRTLDFDTHLLQENYESITLLDEEYFEVISNTTNFGYKFYFNKSDGLFAFEDTSGVLWKIEN